MAQFGSLEIDSAAWVGLEETAATPEARHHIVHAGVHSSAADPAGGDPVRRLAGELLGAHVFQLDSPQLQFSLRCWFPNFFGYICRCSSVLDL